MSKGLGDRLLRAIRPRWLFRARRNVPSVRRGPVTHVVILDGTMSSLEDGEESNAGLIYRLLSEQSGPELSVYYEGGIQWTSWRNTHEVLMGRGINRQIRRAYGYLASRYRPGDRIFFFGYSRGAYAVRSLAGILDRVGLVRAECATERNVQLAYRHYQAGGQSPAAHAFARDNCHEDAVVEMIGAFDTVKSLGLRLPMLWKLTEPRHAFHNHALSHCVKSGFHALALEETRAVYAPVMWKSDPDWSGRLEQVWFAGTHGDVGGQIGGFDEARPLSNLPLTWMLLQAELHGMPLPPRWRDRFPTDPEAPSVGTWQGWSKLFLIRQKRPLGQDPSERIHESAIARGLQFPLSGAARGA
ncbi:hypothetical protein OB2597_00760 [Pseudooceanicola batsensis HTCC2597]|uniref:T6SS Phospholipase effector Tle1-like catalytic domain-containing protein n=1 Tax=Pseudooceanicola batsensis (strain ATCC BAA-863 / DSM 15984 / KCTC 12145 / HTCC2597) TaxID=252305 RepID=A3U1W9_PSEBH|nr:DUF2235 domain-containing protein [Pseudooceanicola batsensis]EAQ01903.1 hypothetical protein OB2597_00760 [Pseudooceanicola batsensis HTCC2597]